MIAPRYCVTFALLALALTGCSAPESTPELQPNAQPDISAADAALIEQLRVPNPKDMRERPRCGLLTAPQLAQLGLQSQPGGQEQRGNVAKCFLEYTNDPANVAAYATLIDAVDPPMPGIYYTREASALFEPTAIAGHPAVRDEGLVEDNCNLEVAVADDQLLSIGTNQANRPGQDACGLARRMAEMILAALPPKR